MWRGASVVHLVKMEFCERDFGERSNSSSERARRGEEDGMVVGGQGGVYGGGDGGEGGGGNGLFGGKEEEEEDGGDGVVMVVVVGMEEEMEEKEVEELVVEKVEMVGGEDGRDGRPWEGVMAVFCSLLAAVGEERKEIMKERRSGGLYIKEFGGITSCHSHHETCVSSHNRLRPMQGTRVQQSRRG